MRKTGATRISWSTFWNQQPEKKDYFIFLFTQASSGEGLQGHAGPLSGIRNWKKSKRFFTQASSGEGLQSQAGPLSGTGKTNCHCTMYVWQHMQLCGNICTHKFSPNIRRTLGFKLRNINMQHTNPPAEPQSPGGGTGRTRTTGQGRCKWCWFAAESAESGTPPLTVTNSHWLLVCSCSTQKSNV